MLQAAYVEEGVNIIVYDAEVKRERQSRSGCIFLPWVRERKREMDTERERPYKQADPADAPWINLS